MKIKKLFNEQYTLWIISDMMAVNAKMTSKTQIRWDLNVLNISDDEVEIKLLLLDHVLLEANNPYIKEIASLTQTFSRMYNELHLIITQQGKIKKVLNMDIILAKWNQTKVEMEKIAGQNSDLKKMINLNDTIFQNPAKLTESIQASEFFSIYFNYVFGTELPYKKRDISKPNFFNTANVMWTYTVSEVSRSISESYISLKGEPTLPLSVGFYNKAYAQFAKQINISKLNTTLEEEGEYIIESETGRLIKAQVKRNEIADKEELFTKVTYQMMSEATFMNRIKEENSNKQEKTTSTVENRNVSSNQSNIYKMYKGRKYTKEEWVKKEQELWEEYAQKNNLKIEKDNNKSGKFFLDEKNE